MQMAYGTQCTPAIFAADFAMYHGQYREAIQLLRKLPFENDEDEGRRCYLHMKLASLHFCLGEHPSVAEQIVQAILCFGDLKAIKTAGGGGERMDGVPDAPEDALEDRRRLREIKQATPR